MVNSRPLRIGILPLGLIGGSLAKAFARTRRIERAAGGIEGTETLEIRGFATRQAVLDEALADGAIDRGALMPRILQEKDWEDKLLATGLLADLDVIFICTPVETIAPLARFLAKHTKALLTDVGSVKRQVMHDTEGLPFIGGHPMAGSERTGYYCASESLFDHATYALCPPAQEIPDQEARLQLLEDLVRRIGARSLRLEAIEHDRLVALISHLPHVVAAGLVNTALAEEDELAVLLAAGGFRDITRIASSDPGLWAGISLESGEELDLALEKIIRGLESFRAALAREDRKELQAYFAEANEKRQLVPQQGVGPLVSDFQILLDIEDKPGVLADLTALLSRAEINIHNLSIQDVRQYEGGQVRLFISSPKEAERARALLAEAGYDIKH